MRYHLPSELVGHADGMPPPSAAVAVADRRRRRGYAHGASAFALAVIGVQSPVVAQPAASAQQTAASPAPDAQQPARGTDRGSEEIVVTAQRRSQRLQDVPIAVTVIGGGTLGSQSITSSRDLATIVPGLVSNQKGTSPIPYLRGIGTNVSTPGTEPPVVTYVDGLYLVSPVLGNTDLSDVEQVEVLKGPQGTTFGRNAVAGVINVTTRTPEAKPQLQASVAYSSYDTKEVKAYGSTGLTDDLAVGLAAVWHTQGKGWGRNTFLNIPAFYRDTLTLRGKVKWDVSAKVNVLASAFYQRQNSDLGSFSLAPGTTALSSGVQYTNPGFYDTINNNTDGLTSHGHGGFVKTTVEFGFANLSSQIGYQHLDAIYFTEGDFTPDPRLLVTQDFIDKALTNEILLTSKGSGDIVWLAGLFLLHQDTSNVSTQAGKSIAGNTLRLDARQQTNSVAPFTNVTWQFLPGAHATIGLRYTLEERRFVDARTITAAGVITQVPVKHLDYKQFTYRGSLDYKLGPVLVYGSINRGATTGFFQLPNPTLPPVDPAQLTAYEVGFKSELFDRVVVLNASAFKYDYKNVVVTARSPIDGTNRLQNGAKARSRGIDVDFIVRPLPRLSLSGGFEVLDAKYTNFAAASVFTPAAAGGNTQIIADVSGKRLLNAPKFSLVASANYTALTPAGKLLLAANYSHKSRLFFTVNNNIDQDAYDLVNLSATLTLPSDRFSIGVFVKNVGDVRYDVDGTRTAPGTSHLPGEPRIIGARVGVSL